MATKIISLFNHKGGVSKTTTTFHLGWKLARLGKKVLMVDADPQCNLTGLTLGIEDYDTLAAFYDSKKNTDIFSSIAPAFGLDGGMGMDLRGADVAQTHNPNLFLLAGHIRFSEIDIQLATAITTSINLPVLKDFPGVIYSLLDKTAKRHDFDIILIDMSPSVSATNMCLLMGSDYFIVPTSPDFYCYQAIDSLAKVLPNWANKMQNFKDGITLPRANPKLIGTISQNYRVYTTEKIEVENKEQRTMSRAFQDWADKIKNLTNTRLVSSLREKDMVIPEKIFSEAITYDSPYNLVNIPNYNVLLPTSQKKSKPIYELTQEDGDGRWQGSVWTQKNKNGKDVGVKQNIEEADSIYTKFAQAIINIIQ